MKRWLRRLGYALITLIWFVFVSLPVIAFILADRGQLQAGDDRRHVRLFLLQEVDVEGIGVEWTRPLQEPTTAEAAGRACTRTSVYYLTWKGEGDSVAYCQCYEPESDNPVSSGPATCP